MSSKECPECHQPVAQGNCTTGCHGCDPDADIKIQDSPKEAVPPEVCYVCQAQDGRAIKTLLLNRHLCGECSQLLFDLAVALRLRLNLFAVDCVYKPDFAKRIVENLR